MKNEKIKIVAISGSLRQESYNRKALQLAKRLLPANDVAVEELNLKELNLPFYDEDIEAGGFPSSVKILKSAVESADIVLIASPEYNHSISGVLKNAIDWLSRGNNSLNKKVAAIFGASTSVFGTVRGQNHLRQILAALNVSMVPQPQVFIRLARDAFNDDGSLKDQKLEAHLTELIQNTILLHVTLKNSNK